MKSLRGMPASRTRDDHDLLLELADLGHVRAQVAGSAHRTCAATACSSMNSSDSFLRAFSVFGSLAPSFAIAPSTCGVDLGDRRRSGARPLPDPDRCRRLPLRSSSPSSASSSSSVFSSAAATTSILVGFCGCAMTSGAFGSMKPTMMSTRRRLAGLDRLVGLQQEVVGRRVHRRARGAPRRGLPRCAWRCGSRPRASAAPPCPSRACTCAPGRSCGRARHRARPAPRRLPRSPPRRRARTGSVAQQRLGIRCLLVHRDAHVVDRVDDVFDLLRIDDLGGQVIVDLRIGQVALLLAARDQQLQLRLAVFGHRPARAARCPAGACRAASLPRCRGARGRPRPCRATGAGAPRAGFFAGRGELAALLLAQARTAAAAFSAAGFTALRVTCAAGRFLWAVWACAYVSCIGGALVDSPYVLPNVGRLKGGEGKAPQFYSTDRGITKSNLAAAACGGVRSLTNKYSEIP